MGFHGGNETERRHFTCCNRPVFKVFLVIMTLRLLVHSDIIICHCMVWTRKAVTSVKTTIKGSLRFLQAVKPL